MSDINFITDADAIRQLLESNPVAAHLAQVGLGVETTAKRLCPVDTGRLRSSINSQVGTDDQGLLAVVGTDVDYAPHVEFGTSKMAPQSFLRAALEQRGVG